MNMCERINIALDKDYKGEDGLLAVAYWIGKHNGAKEVCDSAMKIFKEQKDRASKVRYKHEALRVQGDISQIYHPDYSSDFSDWEVEDII